MATKIKTHTTTVDGGIQRKIKKIKSILLENKVVILKAILFGSHARGDSSKDSDIDLCIIVPDTSKDLSSMGGDANKFVALAGITADIIITSDKKYKTDMVSPLLHEIRKHGREV